MTAARGELMGRTQPAIHRSIVVVDVEKFGDPIRTNTHQLAAREGMYSALIQAFRSSGIEWTECTIEDRGDGVLILVSPNIPKCWLASRLPGRLAVTLTKYNGTCCPEARIRLRMALHAGEVIYDSHGVVGSSVNYAFRLVESSALKSTLNPPSELVALIVSNWFFDEVVQHDIAAEPSCFRSVPVAVKETRGTAWVRSLGPSSRRHTRHRTFSLYDHHYVGKYGLPVSHRVQQVIQAKVDGSDRKVESWDTDSLKIVVTEGPHRCAAPPCRARSLFFRHCPDSATR